MTMATVNTVMECQGPDRYISLQILSPISAFHRYISICICVLQYATILKWFISQRWDKVVVLQVTSKSQVFAFKSRVKSQVKTGRSESSPESCPLEFES